ncbi:hypothetical protein EJ08DRAFT_646596 [Tothia fuscella]|uniref:Uncharacterized protein n=1 Tax=Tothia fuscella TaxID=1048955 RepID=A0A9P4NZW3_9PEZI|nr:hypothetical protein EJ08DRAFT_646596 [Tothia fuscella]
MRAISIALAQGYKRLRLPGELTRLLSSHILLHSATAGKSTSEPFPRQLQVDYKSTFPSSPSRDASLATARLRGAFGLMISNLITPATIAT